MEPHKVLQSTYLNSMLNEYSCSCAKCRFIALSFSPRFNEGNFKESEYTHFYHIKGESHLHDP